MKVVLFYFFHSLFIHIKDLKENSSSFSSWFQVNYATSAPIEWARPWWVTRRQTNTTTRNSRASPNESFSFLSLFFFLTGKCVARGTVNYIRKCCLFLYYIASWQTSNALFCTRSFSLSLSLFFYTCLGLCSSPFWPENLRKRRVYCCRHLLLLLLLRVTKRCKWCNDWASLPPRTQN